VYNYFLANFILIHFTLQKLTLKIMNTHDYNTAYVYV